MTSKFDVRPLAVSRDKKIKHIATASAYQSRSKLYAGSRSFDFSGRAGDLVFKKVILPASAPPGFKRRQTLCNALQLAPAFVDGLVARWLLAEFPMGISEGAMKKVALRFCEDALVVEGMCVDLAIHNPAKVGKPDDPHMHAIISVHEVTTQGFTKYRKDWHNPALHSEWEKRWMSLISSAAAKKN